MHAKSYVDILHNHKQEINASIKITRSIQAMLLGHFLAKSFPEILDWASNNP